MKTLIAVPVFNEQKYVARVLDRILTYASDVLVVDDGSTDDTPAILAGRRDITVHTHAQNLGYGESIIDAFDYAARHHYDWVITMDCDEQHEPERIVDFLSAIAADDADIISGSRYLRADWATAAAPADRRSWMPRGRWPNCPPKSWSCSPRFSTSGLRAMAVST